MAPFPVDRSLLVAGCCGTALWGCYTTLMILYGVLLRARSRSEDEMKAIIRPTTVAIILMYLMATAHAALLVYELFVGFTMSDSLEGGATGYFTYGTPPAVAMVKNLMYVMIGVIGDAIILWRLFVVWNGSLWICIFPAIIITVACVTGSIGSCIYVYHTSIPTFTTFRLIGSFIILSLAANCIMTALIAGRVIYQFWKFRNILGRTGGYERVLLVIVESAAVIVIARVIELTLGLRATTNGLDPRGNNAVYIVTFSMPQILGIVPLCLLIAVHVGFTNVTTVMEKKPTSVDSSRVTEGRIVFATPTSPSQSHSSVWF